MARGDSGQRPPSLDAWVRGIHERDLPVLGGTMREICNAADDGGSSASDLARVVLRDVGLTSDIIRSANSVYFNPGGQRIATVSRAVVLLGFDTVRSIGLSLALLDSLVRGHGRARVHRLFAESVEAALCARALAESRGERAPEELFIGALLGRVGELAFWCLAEPASAEELEAALEAAEPGTTARECERDCLGFSLRDLSRALAAEWHLGELVEDALRAGGPVGPRARMAAGAHEVVAALAAGRTGEATRQLRELGARGDGTADAVVERIRNEGPAIARALGVQMPGDTASAPPAADSEPREPDAALQMRVLREMAVSVREGGDLQGLFDLIIEGLYRGLALERCAVATLRRGGEGLRLRASLGDSGGLADALAEATERTAVDALLRDTTTVIGARERKALPHVLDDALLEYAVVGPLRANGRTLGVILGETGQAPDERLLDAFDHFVEQAQLCVGHLILAGR